MNNTTSSARAARWGGYLAEPGYPGGAPDPDAPPYPGGAGRAYASRLQAATGAGGWTSVADRTGAPAAHNPLRGIAQVPVPASRHGGTDMLGEWPLQDGLELGALPDAVPCARLHTRQVLWEWGLTALSDNAELLVSELLTNAVNAARSVQSIGPVRLWLLSDRAQLLVLVWDANPLPPVRVYTGEDTESGRGLMLVETVGRQWDWYAPEWLGGKVVWALL